MKISHIKYLLLLGFLGVASAAPPCTDSQLQDNSLKSKGCDILARHFSRGIYYCALLPSKVGSFYPGGWKQSESGDAYYDAMGSIFYLKVVENPENCFDTKGDFCPAGQSPVDGVCVTDVPGCTDSDASNYNSLATVDDGSCLCPEGQVLVNGECAAEETDASFSQRASTSCLSGARRSTKDECRSRNPTKFGVQRGANRPYGCYQYDATEPFIWNSYYSNFACSSYLCSCTTPAVVHGCTDSTASNYDLLATINDGSCVTDVPGCTDSDASNYDATATVDDGSCLCTTRTACNFKGVGTCVYPNDAGSDAACTLTGDGGRSFLITAILDGVRGANDDDGGESEGVLAVGATHDRWPSSCTSNRPETSDLTIILYGENNLYKPGYIGCGGKDFTAAGYTNGAWKDQVGSAITYDLKEVCPPATPFFQGAACVAECDAYFAANADEVCVRDSCPDGQQLVDGSCLVLGCTDSDASNYDATATVDDGSCVTDVLGCMELDADNYDATATVNVDGMCEYLGCADPAAFNYNPKANVDDGMCEYLGCIDSTAYNYDGGANVDDGTCEYRGCMDPNAFNYDENANVDDGTSCVDKVFGCMSNLAVNYDPNANTNDNTCSFDGCTYSTASNYNSLATKDDGSCEWSAVVHGCTDSTASNYNSLATVDDGSCESLATTECNLNKCNDMTALKTRYAELAVKRACDPSSGDENQITSVDVSWLKANGFASKIFEPLDTSTSPPTSALRQNLLGNFNDNWEVIFPLVDKTTELFDFLSSDEGADSSARQSFTFAYNIFDQALTFAQCSTDAFSMMRPNVFESSVGMYESAYELCDETLADDDYADCKLNVLLAFTDQYPHKCFDLDIAGDQFNVMETTFADLKTLGYRITIPEGSQCQAELPHFAVFGKSKESIDKDVESFEPVWSDLTQNSYVPDARPITGLGPGTHDIYVHHGRIKARQADVSDVSEASEATEMVQEKTGPLGTGMQDTDHLVRISLITQSAQVVETSDACKFTMEKIYLNDKTYNLVN